MLKTATDGGHFQEAIRGLPAFADTLLPSQNSDVLARDALWSCVRKKEQECWLWVALCRRTRQIMAYPIGDRSQEGAWRLRAHVPADYRRRATRRDYWLAYESAFAQRTQRFCGKEEGETQPAERWFGTLRARLSRLVRRTSSFSKQVERHLDAIHLFLTGYHVALKQAFRAVLADGWFASEANMELVRRELKSPFVFARKGNRLAVRAEQNRRTSAWTRIDALALEEDRPCAVWLRGICRHAAKAIDFYQKALGATVRHRMKTPDGKILHAEMQLADSVLMISDEFPDWGSVSPQTLGGTASTLHVYVPDADAAFAQAVAAGATEQMPVQNQFWGDRSGYFLDPFGHRWGLATRVEEVSPEETERRGQEWARQAAA